MPDYMTWSGACVADEQPNQTKKKPGLPLHIFQAETSLEFAKKNGRIPNGKMLKWAVAE